MPKRKTPTIWKAAEDGDIETLKNLLDAGADVNDVSATGDMPLHVAALYSHVEAVKLLIERGADVNAISGDDDVPLSCALYVLSEVRETARGEDYERDGRVIARMLFEHGADPNIDRGPGRDTLLFNAVRALNAEDVKLLLEFGADVNRGVSQREGATLLHAAIPREDGIDSDVFYDFYDFDDFDDIEDIEDIENDNDDEDIDDEEEEAEDIDDAEDDEDDEAIAAEAVCEILLRHGVNLESMDNNGRTPLAECIMYNQCQLAAFFLKHGANPNTTDNEGRTPLHHAASLHSAEATKLLLNSGANPNAADNESRTPLFVAAAHYCAETVAALLDAGADINAANDMGFTPLHMAAFWSNVEIAKLLIERGADVNAFSGNDITPLGSALSIYIDPFDTRESLEAWKSESRVVARILLEHGADPNVERSLGSNMLLYEAVCERDVGDAKLLLEFGADANCSSWLHNGATALYAAVPDEYIADTADTDPRENSFPIEETLCESLLLHGANPDGKDDGGHTPLSRCIARNQFQMAAFFLTHGANPNTADNDGRSPLHKAAALCRTETAALLLEHGADINARDNTGETPLHVSVRSGKWPVTEFLLRHGADLHAKDKSGKSPLNLEKDKELRALMRKHASASK